jgi:hypothetical protein
LSTRCVTSGSKSSERRRAAGTTIGSGQTQMEKVGLMPSSTGEPGGKRVGPRMTHYIIENGAFAKAFAAMPATFLLPWRSGIPELAKGGAVAPKKKDPSKVKYTCEGCGTNVWGKIGLRIQCSICEEEFEEVA